jgi:hydroxyethylthiazole kinase-like uncharacterized protein yjeF
MNTPSAQVSDPVTANASDAPIGRPRIVAVPVGPATAGSYARLPAGQPCGELLLHDGAASRRLEASAAAALPPHTLMRRAGLAVARLAQAVAPHARAITVLAGPGNNGGDGFEAAMHLHRLGREVGMHFFGDAARLPADALASLHRAREAGVPIEAWSEADGPARLLHGQARRSAAASETLLIDALLGRGLTRPAEGRMAGAIEAINRCGAPVLAVDLPSGLPADTGSPASGAAVVQAQTTLALLSLAPGLFTGQGREASGRIWWDDLGVDGHGEAAVARLTDPATGLAAPTRRHGQHKGSFGDVRVVAGAPSMTGAALLAGRAALHAGAGRVYLHLLDERAPRFDAVTPELMFADPLTAAHLTPATTVLAGCGGGAAVAEALPLLIEAAPRLVLDADALNAIAQRPDLQDALRSRGERGGATVLTPHPLEAARLLCAPSVAVVQADRLAAATALARRYAAVVLLKGSGSVIAAPGERPWINPTGNAALAVPGSGDVLAGWLAGLWSPLPALRDTALTCTVRAAYRHGWLASARHPDGTPLPAGALAAAIGGPLDPRAQPPG